jgi:hypothetical protein
MALLPPVHTVYVPFTQVISYALLVTGEVAVTTNVPEALEGIAAATTFANSQLVVELTATDVDPWHNDDPAGGNASAGVPVGVLGAVADDEPEAEPLAFADDAELLAGFEDAGVDPLGVPPPVNQRTTPITRISTSTPSRIITPRAPDRFARDGPTGAGTA